MIKNIKQYENAILVTHNDLDGAVCEILTKSSVKVEVTYICDYKNINEKVQEIIKSEKQTRRHRPIIITDISVNEDVAKLLEDYYKTFSSVLLIDHHKTALFLNQYFWAYVNVDESASMLVYKELTNENLKYHQLATLANDYDMWLHKNVKSKWLNMLFWNINRKVFIERFIENPIPDFTESEYFLIHAMVYQRDEYTNKMLGKVKVFNDEIGETTYRVGLVIADRNISELGNAILDAYKEIDIALILNLETDTASVRSRAEFDCTPYAKFFGGSGHKNASGFPLIHIEDLMYLLSVYYEGEK